MIKELLNRATDLALLIERSGIVVYANHPDYLCLGDDAKSFEGENLIQLAAANPDGLRWFSEMAPHVLDGKTWEGGVAAVDAQGQPRYFSILLIPESNAHSGQVDRVLLIRRDATEDHEHETRVAQNDRMDALAAFASRLAHDLNNQLQVINGYAEMIQEMLPSGSPLVRDASEIFNAGKRAQAITGRLILFGRRTLQRREAFYLNAMLKEMLPLLSQVFGPTIQVQSDISAPESQVSGDSVQLKNAIMNVCANAKACMPAGGVLTIRTRNDAVTPEQAEMFQMSPGPVVVLEIEDSGCGMDADTLSRAFEPFFTTNKENKEAGFGLPAAYGIVRQHNGYIDITSAPGKGATCSIWLSLSDALVVAPNAVEAPSVYKDGMGRGETILLVDDEVDVLRVIQRHLSRNGYHVIVAHNGQEGADIYAADPTAIDFIMSDVLMPKLDGPGMIDKMREATGTIPPFILFSGYSSDVQRVQDSGAERVFTKPVEMDVVLSSIRHVLDQKKK